MGDVAVQYIVNGIVAIALAWIGYKLQLVTRVTNDTHTLVNSNMGIQLKLNAELARWKSDQTKNANDLLIAVKAEEMYMEHMRRQSVVDASNNTKPVPQ